MTSPEMMETTAVNIVDDQKKIEEKNQHRLNWSLYSSGVIASLQIILFTLLIFRLTIKVTEWIDLNLVQNELTGTNNGAWIYPRPNAEQGREEAQNTKWSEYAIQYGNLFIPSVFPYDHYGSQVWNEYGMTMSHITLIVLLAIHIILTIFMGIKLLKGIVTQNSSYLTAWIIFAVYFLLILIMSDLATFFCLLFSTCGSVRLLTVFVFLTIFTIIGIHIVCKGRRRLRRAQGIVDEDSEDTWSDVGEKDQSGTGKGDNDEP